MNATELRQHLISEIEAASTSLSTASSRDVLRHVDGPLPDQAPDRAFYVRPLSGVMVPQNAPVPCAHRWAEFLVSVFYGASPSSINRALEDSKHINDKLDHLAASHVELDECTHDGGLWADVSETLGAMEYTIALRFQWG